MPTQRKLDSSRTCRRLNINRPSRRHLLATGQPDRQEMGRTRQTIEQTEEGLHPRTRRNRMPSRRSSLGGVKNEATRTRKDNEGKKNRRKIMGRMGTQRRLETG